MPYNTRRKSISLPGLGIHVPMTHAARAAAAAAAAASSSASKKDARLSSSSSSSSASSMSPPSSRPEPADAHSNKRQKRSHGADAAHAEQTPPPSPSVDISVDMMDAERPPKIDLEGINDDIVEAVILQLQATANRPHLVKELATVLSQRLTVVQHSANPCAIISSRLAAYLKRSCWSALARCPLAKELETVHPRRTYFFLTTYPRQPLPESTAALPSHRSVVTPSVSLTDDSTSDDADCRRRELSPSPEVDLSPEFEDIDEDVAMPATPMGSLPGYHSHRIGHRQPHSLPPLEKDEREFTQTADVLQKRKLNKEVPMPEVIDRNSTLEYGYRDDIWFGEHRIFGPAVMTSPSIKPSVMTNVMSSAKKDEEAESWLKLSKLLEWDKTAESIEIDELDGLLDSC